MILMRSFNNLILQSKIEYKKTEWNLDLLKEQFISFSWEIIFEWNKILKLSLKSLEYHGIIRKFLKSL